MLTPSTTITGGVSLEDIYLKDYADIPALEVGLEHYFTFYNTERLHQSLAYRVPAEVHKAEGGSRSTTLWRLFSSFIRPVIPSRQRGKRV